jgi:hypothetical protein
MENFQKFVTDSKAIAVAGTAEQLTEHRVVQGHYLTIHAGPNNTGNIFIGESKAQAEANNFTLTPDASVQIATDNVSDVWVDVAVNGERVEWIVEIDNLDV